ncbi:MAG: hypothetical protein ACOVN9_07015 [Inhella sp.]
MVTTDHIERAYAQLRRADWPSLAEMQRWATQFAVVRGRAVSMAHGKPLPQEPAAAGAPQPISPRAAGHTERQLQRRRIDAPQFDHKRAAAGERPDDE